MNKQLKFKTSEHNVFFTSDTHFDHENIMKFCNRPFKNLEDMNESIINRWNSVVKPNDIVFHLGDFSFCGSQKFNSIFDRLNGKIYLCIGNHDVKSLSNQMLSRFEDSNMQYYITVDGQKIYLNHFPYLCFAGSYREPDRCTWQLFGHVHSGPNQKTGMDNERLIHLFPTQYDVGVDNNNFTPISFAEVKEIITNQIMSLNLYRGTKE